MATSASAPATPPRAGAGGDAAVRRRRRGLRCRGCGSARRGGAGADGLGAQARRRRRSARRGSRPRRRRLTSADSSRKRTTVMLSRPPRSLAARIRRRAAVCRSSVAGEDRGDVLVVEHRRQPVGAEQEDVAGAGAEGHRVDVDLRLGPERAGDHRPLRVLGGLVAGQLALAPQLLDQRVVVGDLLELALAEDVGAAVADVAEADLVAVQQRGGQRRPHARSARSRPGRGRRSRGWPPGRSSAAAPRGRRRPRRRARMPRPPSATRPRRPGRRPSRRRPRTAAPARSSESSLASRWRPVSVSWTASAIWSIRQRPPRG